MDIKTKLIKLGRNPKKQKGFINPGIYKGSTIIFDNFKHYLKDIDNNDDRKTLYGINTNSSHYDLENCISKLYNCDDTIIAPSGLAALVIPFFVARLKFFVLRVTSSPFCTSSFANII